MKWFFRALAALLVVTPAHADWAGRDANGTSVTFKGVTCASVTCPQFVLVDPTATAWSAGNPFPISSAALEQAQASTTSGQKGPLVQCAVTTSAPSYTTAQTDPLSCDTTGGLRISNTFSAADAVAGASVPLFEQGLYNGATVDRQRSASGDAMAATGLQASAGMGWNGATWDRLRSVNTGQMVATLKSSAGNEPVVATSLGDAAAFANSLPVTNTPALFNGSTWDRQRSAAGTTGVAAVNTESTKATYTQCIGSLVLTTATGDIFVLQGSGTKTVRVTRISYDATITSATSVLITIGRRSSAASGGTTASLDTQIKHDTNNAASTAVVTAYSAVPTPGTAAGNIRRDWATLPAPGGNQFYLVHDFTSRNEQGLVVRGTSDYVALVVGGGAAGAGNTHNICMTWTEE